MKWEDYAADFDFDGSWRDIYILETSLSDWQKLLDFLKSSDHAVSYQVDELQELPGIVEIFDKSPANKGLLCVKVGDVTLNCHFFSPEEIEFDFDPREVQGEVQANGIFDFMIQLGRALNREVILTPESSSEITIFKYSPVTREVEFFPVTNDSLDTTSGHE